MSQLIWTYVGPNNKLYDVGLYHGDSSRHLLVYCNQMPIIIDFSIDFTKTYHFYIGEELCLLTIHDNGDETFSYRLEIDEHTETPLNIQRKTFVRKYWLWATLLAICFAILIGLLTYFIVSKF